MFHKKLDLRSKSSRSEIKLVVSCPTIEKINHLKSKSCGSNDQDSLALNDNCATNFRGHLIAHKDCGKDDHWSITDDVGCGKDNMDALLLASSAPNLRSCR